MKLTKSKTMLLMLSMLSILCIIFMATQKKGMILDEYFSYGLANSTYEGNHGKYCIYLPQGEVVDSKAFFDNYFFASKISVKNVWLNQGYDVHPPVYYLLLHLFGRMTGNVLGFDTGIVLNLLLHIINIVLIYCLIQQIIKDKFWAYLGVAWYAFLPIVIDYVLYIRMYYLLITWILLISLWMIKGVDQRGSKIRFYVGLAIISALGVLTHYYFVVYLFYLCMLWGIYLLIKRNWKEIVAFFFTMGAAGISCLIIFPAMKYHILHGNRGQESINSLLHSNYLDFLGFYKNVLNHLAGGILLIFVLSGIFALIYVGKKYRAKISDKTVWKYLLIVFPVLMFYLSVSKIGVMHHSRFITPIFGTMIIVLTSFLCALHMLLKNRNIGKIIAGIIVVAVLWIEWQGYQWVDLSRDDSEGISIASEYGKENDCFYIYRDSEHSMVSYDEFIKYDQICFWKMDTPPEQMKAVLDNYEHLVVYFDVNGTMSKEEQTDYLDRMLEQSESMGKYTHLYDGTTNSAYYLE